MYEHLMEAVVEEDNRRRALEAVKRNRGAAGIDHMTTSEMEARLQAHWEKIRAKLLAGTYVPSPVRRMEIPKPSGGTRTLGIPTVLDRFIQQPRLARTVRTSRGAWFMANTSTVNAGLKTATLRRHGFWMPIGSCGLKLRPPRSTAGCGKPHVRWCGRAPRRNPGHSTRSRKPASNCLFRYAGFWNFGLRPA